MKTADNPIEAFLDAKHGEYFFYVTVVDDPKDYKEAVDSCYDLLMSGDIDDMDHDAVNLKPGPNDPFCFLFWMCARKSRNATP